jgi:hypothetical protein
MGKPISGWLQCLVRPTIHRLIRAVLVRLLIGQRLVTGDSPHLNPLSSERREGRVRGGGNRKSPPYLVENALKPLDLAPPFHKIRLAH